MPNTRLAVTTDAREWLNELDEPIEKGVERAEEFLDNLAKATVTEREPSLVDDGYWVTSYFIVPIDRSEAFEEVIGATAFLDVRS